MALEHELPLVSTVVISLSAAFICGLVASKLRIPPIVGYLLAGVLIGPYTPGPVADIAIANQLAEIGIVLLMFGVGLHFSLKDLLEVKKIAIPGAIVQILAATGMGAGLAYFWGWSIESCLMFGLALSVASTVVLLRSLEEHNLLYSMNGRIAIGWLIVEDLAMIFALVLIPALAGMDKGQAMPLQQFFAAIGKVALFIALMLVAGKRILPWVLSAVAKTRSRELFTLAVFAVAVGLAFGAAELFGVSFALGAFFAGMVIRESDMNHEVAHRALPFQDAFAVLFFVGVGMLFDPSVLLTQPLQVLAVVAIIMVGKSIAAFLIVWLFGYPLKTGLFVSAGLAQIGEFSFVLIALGIMHGLLPEEARDLILAGALISIGLNPITFHGSRIIHRFIEKRPQLSKFFKVWDDGLARLQSDEKKALKKTVVLAGCGRVGRFIYENFPDDFDLVLVDANRERVQDLRAKGFHAIAGDAGQEDTLKEAAIHKAIAVIVAVPDAFEARRIVEAAQSLKPSVKILVRAHNDAEVAYLHEHNVDLAITGPSEIGRRMVMHLQDIKQIN